MLALIIHVDTYVGLMWVLIYDSGDECGMSRRHHALAIL